MATIAPMRSVAVASFHVSLIAGTSFPLQLQTKVPLLTSRGRWQLVQVPEVSCYRAVGPQLRCAQAEAMSPQNEGKPRCSVVPFHALQHPYTRWLVARVFGALSLLRVHDRHEE